MFSIVVATDLNLGIGKSNTLPWRIKKDMNYFKDLTISGNPEEIKSKYDIWNGDNYNYLTTPFNETCTNTVIMGRKTWDSIPPKFRPLDKRFNCIVSRTLENTDDKISVFRDLNSAIQKAEDLGCLNLYVIGGAEIYKHAIEHEKCERIYQTSINKVFDCDTFFPSTEKFEQIASSAICEENGIEFRFRILRKK